MESTSGSTTRPLGWIALAWTAFFVLWLLFILGYAEGNVGVALRSSAIATLLAASASPLIWRLSGRRPWPSTMQPAFVGVHFGLAILFSVYWTVMNPILEMLAMGESPAQIDWFVPVTGWRVLGGVWLYAIIAGLSYAIRNNARLRIEERRAAAAETEAARARLEALRSQIQPHFLLNALHGISSLVGHDDEAVQEAMERLGELMRYAARVRRSEFVLLHKEWTFVKGYLELQRLRFGDRLRVETEMEEGVGHERIPVFSLQPLVENAVLHGIEPRPEGGLVRLVAERVDADPVRRLRLSVCDDGAGNSAANSTRGLGTGLDSLRARLEELYDGDFTLGVHDDASGETCAVIEVPV